MAVGVRLLVREREVESNHARDGLFLALARLQHELGGLRAATFCLVLVDELLEIDVGTAQKLVCHQAPYGDVRSKLTRGLLSLSRRQFAECQSEAR